MFRVEGGIVCEGMPRSLPTGIVHPKREVAGVSARLLGPRVLFSACLKGTWEECLADFHCPRP